MTCAATCWSTSPTPARPWTSTSDLNRQGYRRGRLRSPVSRCRTLVPGPCRVDAAATLPGLSAAGQFFDRDGAGPVPVVLW
jgi:hypothetical protein